MAGLAGRVLNGFYAPDLPTLRLDIMRRLDMVADLQKDAEAHQMRLNELRDELNRMLDLATRTIENH